MEDRVVDSRASREGRAVRRRRECLACGRRFTTYEYIEERPLQVVKRGGGVEPSHRRKALRSIELAAAKRPVSAADVDAIVEDLEHTLDRSDATEVSSGRLGEMVMERLKTRDHIAYVRFASVYRDFQDPEEFYAEFRDLADRAAQREMRRFQAELPLDPDEGPGVPAAEKPEAAPEAT